MVKSVVIYSTMYILYHFFNVSQMPILMQNVGLACVTILIPVSIALLFPADKSDDVFNWEKWVILDRVIGPKKLVLSLIFLFGPSFLWSVNYYLLNAVLFLFFVVGTWLFFRVLGRVYNWIRHFKPSGSDASDDYRHRLRKAYLQEIKDPKVMESVWSETWGKESDDVYIENDYIEIFIQTINRLRDEKLKEFLLQIFLANFQKRKFGTPKIFETFWRNVLLWRIKCNEQPMIGWYLDSLIRKMVVFALFHGVYSLVLFDVLRKMMKDQEVGKKIIAYVAPTFFDHVFDVRNEGFIWSTYFPKEWKATYENLSEENNFMANIWCNAFLNWVVDRFYDTQKEHGKDKYDAKLDNIVREFFVKVDPMWWAKILTLVVRNHLYDDGFSYLCDHRPIFGSSGRTHGGSFESDEDLWEHVKSQLQQEQDEAINLALKLFPNRFSINHLDTWINDLESLSGIDDNNRARLLNLFEALRKAQG